MECGDIVECDCAHDPGCQVGIHLRPCWHGKGPLIAYNGQHYRPILPDPTNTCSFVRELPRQPRPDRVHNKLLNTGLRKMELMAS
eukprot:799394-Amphidinium_carterae.1